ncbi:hypothetical protein [Streptomyces gulbargensis]
MVLHVNVLNLHAAYDFFQVAKCAPNSKDIFVKDDYFREPVIGMEIKHVA